jgi:hypothetical protein
LALPIMVKIDGAAAILGTQARGEDPAIAIVNGDGDCPLAADVVANPKPPVSGTEPHLPRFAWRQIDYPVGLEWAEELSRLAPTNTTAATSLGWSTDR